MIIANYAGIQVMVFFEKCNGIIMPFDLDYLIIRYNYVMI